MTTESQVQEEVADVSTNPKASAEIQGDQRALDMSSYQGSPKLPVPDCNGNGISHPEDNGIGGDDTEDNSYVFVSGGDDLIPLDNDLKVNARVSDDSECVEVQNGESLKSSASGVDNSRVFEGTEAASSDNCSVDKRVADALQIVVTDYVLRENGRVGSGDSVAEQPENHQIDPKSSLSAEENREPKVGVLESAVDSAGNVQLKSQENSSQLTCEVEEGQELQHACLEATPCRSSEVGILESGADSAGNHEPVILLDIVEAIDVNGESQENNIESTSELGEVQESQHANLEATPSKSSQAGDFEPSADSVGNCAPEFAIDFHESIDVNKKSWEETLESKSELGQDQESQNDGLEAAFDGSSEVKFSKGNEAQQHSESSDQSGVTQDSQNMHSDTASHALPQTEVQKVEEQSNTESTSINADSVGNCEPEIVLNVVESIDVDKKAWEENLESKSESGEGRESQNAEVTYSGSLEVKVSKGNETPSSDELGGTQDFRNMHSDSARYASAQTEVQKVEEQPDTESTSITADSVGNPEPEVALDVVESTDVNMKSREENLESKSEAGEDKESQSAGLEVTLGGSSEVEMSKGNEFQQNSESSDESGGVHDSHNMDSDSARHASLQAEVQKVEEQSDTESTIISSVIITEQSESYHHSNLGTDGQKLEEQTNAQLHSDARKIQETVTITVATEKGECAVNPGHKIDKSENEVVLPSDPNENKSPVPSVNGSVPETKKSIEHKDDTEKPLELEQSSESTDSLTSASDSGNGPRPVESDENVLDIAREHEDENKASSSVEDVATNTHEMTNTHEIIKPETGDADNVANENAFDLTRECRTEEESPCLTENDATTAKEVVEQETNVENLEDSVSSVRYSKFKTITVKNANDTSIAGGDSTSSTEMITINEFELETPDPEEVATFRGADVPLKTEVSSVEEDCSDLHSVPSGTEKKPEVGSCSIISSRDIPCNDVSTGNDVSDNFVTKDKLSCFLENVDIESKGESLSSADLNSNDKLSCEEIKDVQNPLNNGKSLSLAENSVAGAVAGQDVVVERLTRPFHFLIKMPRFEDLKMKEQIRKAQLLVEEKTQHRDAFRIEVQKYKANCHGYAAEYDAAVSESRALKRSVKAKRAEIDSLQSVINKVKNAISVEDIDTRIHGMEHMIEHETLPLKEEKQLIHQIKQLKQLREQLSSNIGSQDEVQQALNNRDQIEERLKVLKKELDSLKDSVIKADAVARALEKKYEDENKKVKEVQTQYSAANNVRQDAYAHLQTLRKQLYEKNQQFRMFKDNAAAAADFAVKRDREALHHLCVNQVESIMDLWNKNDEFRRDYIRCNMKSTLRRLGTLDGRSLGPDEQPPVLTRYGDERVERLVSNPANDPILQTQNVEQDVTTPVHDITVGDKTEVKESEQKSPTEGQKKQEKTVLRNSLATVSGMEITDEIRKEQQMLTEEELELARKMEELRKQEDAAKLIEQRRLEERTKALEAFERKKRNAEKAQMRAELRAQKEAEQREKEREKRLRKKERKKGIATEISDGSKLVETTPNCESLTETIKEPEIKENPSAVPKRPQKPSQFPKQSKAKSIPPPLRNRGRRKIQQWMWVILTCLLVVALFLLGNIGFFSNLSNVRRRNSGF